MFQIIDNIDFLFNLYFKVATTPKILEEPGTCEILKPITLNQDH